MDEEESDTQEIETLAWEDVDDERIALLLELAPVVGLA